MGEVWQCSRFEATGSYSKFCILSGFYGMTVCGRALNIDLHITSRLSDEMQGESGALPGIKSIPGTCCEGAVVTVPSADVKPPSWEMRCLNPFNLCDPVNSRCRFRS